MRRIFPLPQQKQFGDYIVTFMKGTKSKNDYIIRINGVQIKDNEIFDCLHRYACNTEIAQNLLKFIWQIGKIEDIREEKNVYAKIKNLLYPDELKAILFSIWHRLIIDDINYPITSRFNGRKRLLGQIYILLAKKFRFELPDYILSLPKEVFDLGFPRGATEKVSTDQWNEIYELYMKFCEGKKNA